MTMDCIVGNYGNGTKQDFAAKLQIINFLLAKASLCYSFLVVLFCVDIEQKQREKKAKWNKNKWVGK